MSEILEHYREGDGFTPINVIDLREGNERLSVTEGLKTWMSNANFHIQKLYSKFTFNVHEVKVNDLVNRFNKQPDFYPRNVNMLLVTPPYFDKEPGWMHGYVKNLHYTKILINLLNTEVETIYSRLTKLAKQGVVPKQFNWNISDTETTLINVEEFIAGLKTTHSDQHELQLVYRNMDDFFKTVNQHNQNVKQLKSRDTESISRRLDNVYDIAQLIVKKVEAGDIKLNEDTLNDISNMFKELNRLTHVTGTMFSLTNECTGILESQSKQFKDKL